MLTVWRQTASWTYMHRFFILPLPYQFLAREAVFWILMGRSRLIQDRKLESSDIFMGRVDGHLWCYGCSGVSF
jgi:hypothetical protein